MTRHPLADIAAWRERAGPSGIPSVCSAHPVVIEAAMRASRPADLPLLIEATCNQVNQEGGYTGLRPAEFRARIEGIAADVGFPADRLILGGDHLGPNPWRDLPSSEAMDRACSMAAAYSAAGYTKLHLDCSMGCAGEPAALGDAETAVRAMRLAAAAEATAPGGDVPPPVYVIGTEVPTPGGAPSGHGAIEVTTPDAVRETVAVHRRAFAEAGMRDAFERVIAVVVQPGFEFGADEVTDYKPEAARSLSATLRDLPGIVFEAHSTDYQTCGALSALVADGFAILKVGPALTFALREALYGLDAVADALDLDRGVPLPSAMEAAMIAEPSRWQGHYAGDAATLRWQRHHAYSDRIRYYWPGLAAEAAVARLLGALGDRDLPEPLIARHLGRLYSDVRARRVPPRAELLLRAAVEAVMADYLLAVGADVSTP